MEVKKHYITHEFYEGEMHLITVPQSLDQVIYDYYGDIKYETVTSQKWTAYPELLTKVIELNPHVDTSQIIEGTSLFMPKPKAQSSAGQIKLWD